MIQHLNVIDVVSVRSTDLLESYGEKRVSNRNCHLLIADDARADFGVCHCRTSQEKGNGCKRNSLHLKDDEGCGLLDETLLKHSLIVEVKIACVMKIKAAIREGDGFVVISMQLVLALT